MGDIDRRAAEIRLLVLDVDGVLTDGRLYYGADGEQLKVFDVRDGHGLKALQRAGVEIAVISGRSGEAVRTRLKDLGIERVHLGIDDKLPVFRQLLETLGLAAEHCAYMGDDEPDLAAMQACGLSMTVADAVPCVREAADWVSTQGGGRGAVREACDLLLSSRTA